MRILRKNGFKAPIIMLTGHNTDSDTILGLESGANDYVAKPFRFAVLLARIRAQLRQHEASEDAVFTIGPYTFRPSSKILLNPKGNKVRLTEKETAILRYLYRAGQRPVSRETLLQEVWGYNSGVTTHTLETHIYRLRQKVEKDAASPSILVTEAGGYKLVPWLRPMTVEDDISLLERMPTLSLLGRQALRILAIGAETRYIHSGEVLFSAGDGGRRRLRDAGGQIHALVAPTDGRDVTVGPCTLLGELALFTETTRPATATALEPSTVLSIPRQLFIKMLDSFPEAAHRLREMLAARLAESHAGDPQRRAALDAQEPKYEWESQRRSRRR